MVKLNQALRTRDVFCDRLLGQDVLASLERLTYVFGLGTDRQSWQYELESYESLIEGAEAHLRDNDAFDICVGKHVFQPPPVGLRL